MSSTAMRTRSGKLIDLLAPDHKDIVLEDVAWGLSGLTRWCGATRQRICVARHSLHVSALVPRPLRLAALIHDGHEFVTGDPTRPFVAALAFAMPGAKALIDRLKRSVDEAIAWQLLDRVGAKAPPEGLRAIVGELVDAMRHPAVKAADDLMLKLEGREWWGTVERVELGALIEPLGSAPSYYVRDILHALDLPEPSRESVSEEWLARVLEEATHLFADPLRTVPPLLGAE